MKDLRILGHDEYTVDGDNCCDWLLAQPLGGPCPAFWKTLMKGESALIQAQDGKEGAGNAGVPQRSRVGGQSGWWVIRNCQEEGAWRGQGWKAG